MMKEGAIDTLNDFDPKEMVDQFGLDVILEGVTEEEVFGDPAQDDISTDEDVNLNVELEVYTAAHNDDLDRMKELIGPKMTDENRLWACKAMHIAAYYNSIKCGRFLIAFNSDVLNALNSEKLSAIDIARRSKNIDFINMCWTEGVKMLNDRAVIVK